jgi:hypothetical protein
VGTGGTGGGDETSGGSYSSGGYGGYYPGSAGGYYVTGGGGGYYSGTAGTYSDGGYAGYYVTGGGGYGGYPFPTTGGTGGGSSGSSDLNCGSSVPGYCARDGAVCVDDWSQARLVDTWCAFSNVTDVALYGNCNGYQTVTVFGSGESGGLNLFNTYYYDLTTGELQRVNSQLDVRWAECIAGESGRHFDSAGCPEVFLECQR